LSVIPTAQLEHINWIAAESSDAPATGQGIVENLQPAGLRNENAVIDILYEGIGENVNQNVLSTAEQSEWQTLDSATSATQAQTDFGAFYDGWLDHADAQFVNALNDAIAAVPTGLEQALFFASLFVNPDNTIDFYDTDPSSLAVAVTTVKVTRTALGFSMSGVSSTLPATQYTLSADGTTITSLTTGSQTWTLDVPIPQPFLAYVKGLPISR